MPMGAAELTSSISHGVVPLWPVTKSSFCSFRFVVSEVGGSFDDDEDSSAVLSRSAAVLEDSSGGGVFDEGGRSAVDDTYKIDI